MAACWRCGTSTPAGANFCPSCGAEVRGDLPDLDVLAEPIVAEGDLVESTDATNPRWLLLTGLVIIAGLVGFFALVGGEDEQPAEDGDEAAETPLGDEDPPDTSAPDEPDTTTDPPEAEELPAPDPEPLDWTSSIGADGYPIGFVAIGDTLFLYTVESATGYSGGPRSRTFERDANGEWTDLGPMVEPAATVNHVAATDAGAVATGADADGRPTVWRSTDGRTWTAETLPDPDDPSAVPQLVAASGDTTVVLGRPLDPYLVLIDVVTERFGDIPAAYPDIRGEQTVVVRGPFGAVLGEVDLEEVGLSPTLFDDFFDDQRSTLWERDGDGWTTSGIEGFPISLFVLENGQIARNLGGPVRPVVSFRGPTGWSEATDISPLWQVFPWGNRLIGPDDRNELSVLGPGPDDTERLDIPGSEGFIPAIVANDHGLAAIQFQWGGTVNEPEPTQTFVVLRDDFTLEAEFGILTLRRDDETVFRGSLDQEGTEDRYRVDTIDGELGLVFLDEDGNDLVRFTVTELAALQAATEFRPPADDGLNIWFTPDGATWFGGPIGDADLRSVGRGQIHLDDDLIVAAVLETPGSDFRLGEPLRFRVLEAPRPG